MCSNFTLTLCFSAYTHTHTHTYTHTHTHTQTHTETHTDIFIQKMTIVELIFFWHYLNQDQYFSIPGLKVGDK